MMRKKKKIPDWYQCELKDRAIRVEELQAGAVLTRWELAMLQYAAWSEDGQFLDGSRRSGFTDTMAEAGYFTVLVASGFHGGVYQITDAGRERERLASPPLGEW